MRNALLLALFLAGCSSIHYPELPGPPNRTHCEVKRENSITGTYRCEFEGEYVIEEVDL